MCYDASLQYASEVGVNAYVKVRMSFLSQTVSSAIRYSVLGSHEILP